MAVTRIFFRNGKILFQAKVIEFSNRENTYNYILTLHAQTLIAITWKSTFKPIFSSYSFWDKCFKLGIYVLGTQKWKCPPCQKWRISNFKFRLNLKIGVVLFVRNHGYVCYQLDPSSLNQVLIEISHDFNFQYLILFAYQLLRNLCSILQ